MVPASTRWAPNQSTATLLTFSTSITIGNIIANRWPTRVWLSVSSPLAFSNRAVSYGSRTNARTTRMPVICSRRMRLTTSIRPCMVRNSGGSFLTTSQIEPASTGTATTTSQDRPTSSRMAMMMPPIMVIGADSRTVADITTSIWTCCTSLVLRVISDGAPKRLSSRAEKVSTRSKIAARRSRPKAIAVLAPK